MPNPCFDLTFNIATLVPGSVHRSQSNSFSPGGKGINVARAAKTLGNSSQILVMLPEVEGEIYKKLLDSEGHQVTYQDIAGQVRHAILLNQNSPEANTVIVGKGPEMNSNDWQKFCDLVENLVQPNEIVVEMGSLPPNYPDNALEMLAQVIHSKGAKLLADTSPACLKTRGREILDFITPNLDEAEAFISNSSEAVYIPSSEAIEERALSAARELYPNVSRNVIVTAGAHGVAVKTEFIELWIPAIELPNGNFKSSVGAGDSFVAGFVTKLESNMFELVEAIKFGMATAAAQCENFEPGKLDPNRVSELIDSNY